MEKKIKIANKLLLLLIFMFGISSNISLAAKSDVSYEDGKQQQVEVSGTVTDAETGDPLPGVNIVVQGTTIGTTTDMDGNYSLEAPADATLVFSFVGYQEQTIDVNGRQEINVALEQAVTELEEVVAIGYGTAQRRDVTGSISSAQSEDLELQQVETPDQALRGKIPGVNVSTGSHAPGGGMAVNIRGTGSISAGGSPLYVIDGTAITDVQGGGLGGGFEGTNPLANLEVSNIQSMEVLKGAAATAIYGSRGSNGVVLITTKEGQAGEQTINYQGSMSFAGPINKLEFIDATYHAKLINENRRLNDAPLTFTEQEIAQMGEGSDWQEAIFRDPAVSQKHQISASGGYEDLRYYVSGNMTDNKGLVKGSALQRIGAQVNTNADITDRLSLEENLQLSHTYIDHAETGSKGYGSQGNMMSYILNTSPIIPVYDEKGNYFDPGTSKIGGDDDNPLFAAEQYIRDSRDWRLLGNVAARYEIIEDLEFEADFHLDMTDEHYGQYWPIGSRAASNGPGEANWDTDQSLNMSGEFLLHYNGEIIDGHRLNFTGGYTDQKNAWRGGGKYAAGFATDHFKYWNMGSAESLWWQWTGTNEWRLISWLGRANYVINDTYIIGLSARADGSSKFGENSKWGYFPSVSVGWRLSNMSFMENVDAINNLKLRLSWGKTGNSRIGVYQSLSMVDFGKDYAFGTNDPGALAAQAEPGGIANPNLGWEEASDYDIGIDLGLFDNRINVTADYYYQKTTKLILGVPLPEQSGYGGISKNIGAMENKGFELSVQSYNVTGDNFSWNTQFNISANENKILDLGGQEYFYTGWAGGGNVAAHGRQVARIQVGKPVGMFYGSVMHPNTVWKDQAEIDAVGTQPGARPGDYRFVDTNGDGLFNYDDDVFTGDPNPDFVYGMTNNFSFGNFHFRLFLQGTYGNDVLMVTKNELAGGTNFWKPDRDNRWTADNPRSGPDVTGSARAGYPNLVTTENTYDGSYLRVKTARLAYNIPVQFTGLESAQVFVAGENILTFTDYPGWDPEVNAATGSNLVKGVDRFPYPSARAVRVGVNIGF